MRSGCSRFIPFLIAAALALVATLSARGQQPLPGRGRPIEFSEPRSDVVSSNVNEMGANKTRLNNLNADFKKPFELFSPADDSISSIRMPAVQPPLPSAARTRRMKELLEKRNDWIFLAPEEYVAPGLTPEEMLAVPEYTRDGAEGRKKTPIERYYERTDKARAEAQAATTNQARGDKLMSPFQTEEGAQELKEWSFGDPQNPSGLGLSGVDQTTKRQSSANFSIFNLTGSKQPTQRSFSEVFGFGKTEVAEPTLEKSRAQEARMQVLKQLLTTGSPTTPNPGADAINPLTSPPVNSLPAVAPAAVDVFPGVGSPSGSSPLTPPPSLLTPTANPAIPNWQTPPPAPASPAMNLPPPTFNIPQRKFF